MRDLFLHTLLERARRDHNIILITADLGFRVLDPFVQELPGQFLNIGIAEQNMIGVATGLALTGKTVVVYSIANFPSLRCLEQIRNDACYHEVNVKIVSIGAGLSYGQLGPSHHATEDIAVMRAMPNLHLYSPGDDYEVVAVTHQMLDVNGVAYLRLDREGAKSSPTQIEPFSANQCRLVARGREVAIVSTGGILSEVLRAAEKLSNHGIVPTIISMPQICPIEGNSLIQYLRNHRIVLTVEEHTIQGGLGGLVSELLLEGTLEKPRFYRVGLRHGFTSVVGDQNYLRHHYKIDAPAIANYVVNLLEKQDMINFDD